VLLSPAKVLVHCVPLRKHGKELGGGHHADPAVEDIVLAFHVDLIEIGNSQPFSEIP
jgi:hypothetical protein